MPLNLQLISWAILFDTALNVLNVDTPTFPSNTELENGPVEYRDSHDNVAMRLTLSPEKSVKLEILTDDKVVAQADSDIVELWIHYGAMV